tara:strand:- start:910 stop:1359 length:450 start_codon:yes stop_codon:yes gene_type:complete
MRNLVLVLIIAPFLLFSQSKEENKQEAYLSFLKSQGFIGEVTDLGNIRFMYEGEDYFLAVDDDEFYFEVFDYMGNSEEGCSNRLRKIVEEVNGSYKTLIVYMIGDDCSSIKFLSSSILANKDDFNSVFKRSLSIVRLGKQKARDKFSEL